jgi:hypothetical protein
LNQDTKTERRAPASNQWFMTETYYNVKVSNEKKKKKELKHMKE